MWAEADDRSHWIEVDGTVEPPAPLLAPLTGRPCVLYQVALGPGLLRLLLPGSRETAGVRFRLRVPGNATLVVDASEGEVRLARTGSVRRRVRLGRDAELDRRLRQVCRRLNRSLSPRAVLLCHERRLLPGQRVEVTGRLVETPAASGQILAGYRQPPRQPLLLATLLRPL